MEWIMEYGYGHKRQSKQLRLRLKVACWIAWKWKKGGVSVGRRIENLTTCCLAFGLLLLMAPHLFISRKNDDTYVDENPPQSEPQFYTQNHNIFLVFYVISHFTYYICIHIMINDLFNTC
jgi:hypothetical protein